MEVTSFTSLALGGRYKIVDRIARGGMAEVYLARHGELSGFHTIVVVKRILPHLASDEQFVTMFLDEAKLAAHLNHPNVIRIFEVGQSGDEFFIAMELVQGLSLAHIIGHASPEGFSERLVAFIGARSASGLHHAHTLRDLDGNPRNVVHRDVSPQNILVGFDGSVKVIDFGVARAYGRVTSTQQGGLKGKIGYMAPEQVKRGDVDARADVFALGVVLWESLARRRLFLTDNELATMRAILDGDIPKLSSIRAVSPQLEAIIEKALQKNPEDRFATAADMEMALEDFLRVTRPVSSTELGRFMQSEFAENEVAWKTRIKRAMTELPPDPDASPGRTGEVSRPSASRSDLRALPKDSGSHAGVRVETIVRAHNVLRHRVATFPLFIAGMLALMVVFGIIATRVLRDVGPTNAPEPPRATNAPTETAPISAEKLSNLRSAFAAKANPSEHPAPAAPPAAAATAPTPPTAEEPKPTTRDHGPRRSKVSRPRDARPNAEPAASAPAPPSSSPSAKQKPNPFFR